MNLKKRISNKLKTTSPYFLFTPLLILYSIYIISVAPSHNSLSPFTDEFRYVEYAQNMLNGFYADSETKYLWSGPGYPIILMPFEALRLPHIVPRLLNAVFLYGAIILFYKTLLFFLSKNKALIVAYLLGLYYPDALKVMSLLFTEPLVFFLVCAYAHATFRLCATPDYRFKTILLSAFLLAYIALTKVIFGYVIMIGLLLFGVCFLIKRTRHIKKMLLVYLLGLLFCTPYLMYTYSLTNHFFYWGNAGGMQLYWMSSPYKGDLGDWYPFSEKIPNYTRYHKNFIDTLAGRDFVEQDSALKTKALEHIVHNPQKYAYNWVANVSRLFFGYPLSYFHPPSNHIYYYWPNAFIAVFSCLFFVPTLLYLTRLPFALRCMILFAFVYLGGSSLVSTYTRFFFIIVPLLMLWLAYMFNRFVTLDFDS